MASERRRLGVENEEAGRRSLGAGRPGSLVAIVAGSPLQSRLGQTAADGLSE
jgi:hypothetical protein